MTEYNNIEVPITTDPMRPQTVLVKFKFDTPKEFPKPDRGFTSYLFGVEDENGQDAGLWANSSDAKPTGLYKALHNLHDVPGNEDAEGNPIKPYRVTAGTMARLFCYQDNPNDAKTKRYKAYFVGGPVKEVGTSTPAPSPQPAAAVPTQSPPKQQQGEPIVNKQQVQDSRVYRPLSDEKRRIADQYQDDQNELLDMELAKVKALRPDLDDDMALRWAIHVNISLDQNLWRYDSLDSGDSAPQSSNGQVDTSDPVMAQLLTFAATDNGAPPVVDKAKRIELFFQTVVDHTTTENVHSAQATLKLLGISNVPQGAAFAPSLYNLVKQVQMYRGFRDNGFDKDAAAAATLAVLEKQAGE